MPFWQEVGDLMELVYGRRSHKSGNLILLAERVHEVERTVTNDAPRPHCELHAEQLRDMEGAAHEQG